MDDLKVKTSDLAAHVEELVQTYYDLAKINATKKAANISSGVIIAVVITVLGLLAVLFAGCALAIWLGDLLGSRAGGFLLASLLFILIMGIAILLKKNTLFPLVRDIIVRKIYE